MVKILFKNGENGNAVDLSSDLLSSLSTIGSLKRKVESRNKGEAGIIGLDSVPVTFYNTPGGLIYNAFNGDLSSVQKYIFEIYIKKSNGEESKRFEGIADFSSIRRPDFEAKISFNVLDKISAFNTINNLERQKPVEVNAPYYVLGINVSYGTRISYEFVPELNQNAYVILTNRTVPSTGGVAIGEPIWHDKELFEKGDIFIHPDIEKEKKYLVVDSGLKDFGNGYMMTWVKVYPDEDISYMPTDWNAFIPVLYFYPKSYYNEDTICLTRITDGLFEREVVYAFDGLKILKTIIKRAWPNIEFINETGYETYPIALTYYSQLIDENPFNSHPIDAIKKITDSMRIYLNVQRSGNILLKSKKTIANGTKRIFNSTLKRRGDKSDFWDKIIDGVEVTVNSTEIVNKEQLSVTIELKKFEGIKPRNTRKIEVLAPPDIELTKEGLKAFALDVAAEEMDFYGARRELYTIETGLTEDMLEWEALDIVEINDVDYFLENINENLLEPSVTFSAVSLEGFDYNHSQILVSMSRENYANVGAQKSSTNITSFTTPQGLEQPYKPFSFHNMNSNLNLLAEIKAGEFFEEIIITVTEGFPQNLFLFRIYDTDGNYLLLAEIPFSLTKIIKPFKKPVMKLFNTSRKIYYDLSGDQNANAGYGLIIIKKFRVGELEQ